MTIKKSNSVVIRSGNFCIAKLSVNILYKYVDTEFIIICDLLLGRHGGIVVSTVNSQQEGSRFSLCLNGFSTDTPTSSYHPKAC